MSTEPALLAAIAAAPDDDLPRLVYADWCDENGQPDKAEFIRTQVELAKSGEAPATALSIKDVLDYAEKHRLYPEREITVYHVHEDGSRTYDTHVPYLAFLRESVETARTGVGADLTPGQFSDWLRGQNEGAAAGLMDFITKAANEAARKVFNSWEENNGPLRDRSEALLDEHEIDWINKDYPDGIPAGKAVTFVRGMPEEVDDEDEPLFEHGPGPADYIPPEGRAMRYLRRGLAFTAGALALAVPDKQKIIENFAPPPAPSVQPTVAQKQTGHAVSVLPQIVVQKGDMLRGRPGIRRTDEIAVCVDPVHYVSQVEEQFKTLPNNVGLFTRDAENGASVRQQFAHLKGLLEKNDPRCFEACEALSTLLTKYHMGMEYTLKHASPEAMKRIPPQLEIIRQGAQDIRDIGRAVAPEHTMFMYIPWHLKPVELPVGQTAEKKLDHSMTLTCGFKGNRLCILLTHVFKNKPHEYIIPINAMRQDVVLKDLKHGHFTVWERTPQQLEFKLSPDDEKGIPFTLFYDQYTTVDSITYQVAAALASIVEKHPERFGLKSEKPLLDVKVDEMKNGKPNAPGTPKR